MASPAPQATVTTAIAVTGLRKSFGQHPVLDGIDLTVPPGTVFALLGPNGAGKTTTVQILSTLIHADGGEATLAAATCEVDAAAALDPPRTAPRTARSAPITAMRCLMLSSCALAGPPCGSRVRQPLTPRGLPCAASTPLARRWKGW